MMVVGADARAPGVSLFAAPSSSSSLGDLPPIAALFVIYFDIKAGYTIAWKQTAPGVSLDGVEFKCLPSGLHNLKEDLVYFVHGPYAGVSAFIQQPAGEEERNALMLSVGVLVPLSYGRLGRGWKHAQNLKDLASRFSLDINSASRYDILAEYYASQKLPTPANSPPLSPTNSPSSLRYRPSASRRYRSSPPMEALRPHIKDRSLSDTKIPMQLSQTSTLSPHHPALSLIEFLDSFGPLVFPIYRAALCRKRILLITQAPVQLACNFVYDISILSTIPLSVSTLLSSNLPPGSFRLRPLFNVGVHDIPFLEEQAKRRQSITPLTLTYGYSNAPNGNGAWVACTTDGVLYLKSSLYDVVVTLPPPHSRMASKKLWPTIECPAGVPVKATQRDLRRYRALRASLERYNLPESSQEQVVDGYYSSSRLFTTHQGEESVCEKSSWPELAYSGFMWWASAGEKRHNNYSEEEDGVEPAQGPNMQEEGEDQRSEENIPLLDDTRNEDEIDDHHHSHCYRRRRSSVLTSVTDMLLPQTPGLVGPRDSGTVEADIIAYFHRLTTRTFGGLADILESSGDEDSEHAAMEERGVSNDGFLDAEPRKELWISKDEMANLGLDRWSKSDELFLEEIGKKFFAKEIGIGGGGIWSCCPGC